MEVKTNKENIKKPVHEITLSGREKITISGVLEVVSAQDNVVCVKTNMGNLQVQGAGLRVDKLSLDDGVLLVDGKVNGIKYSSGEKKSFFARLFK